MTKRQLCHSLRSQHYAVQNAWDDAGNVDQ